MPEDGVPEDPDPTLLLDLERLLSPDRVLARPLDRLARSQGHELAAHGALLVLCARRIERLRALEQELGASRVIPIACDVTHDADVARAFVRVSGLVEIPTALFHPRIVAHVLRRRAMPQPQAPQHEPGRCTSDQHCSPPESVSTTRTPPDQ